MTFSRPTHEQLRKYLDDRKVQGGPPPTPDRIRELLGWTMLQAERAQTDKK